VDRILEQFKHFYGRPPTADEASILEYVRQLLTMKESAGGD
jgi:hypothetical protein